MSTSRAALVELLRDQPEAVTLSALVAATGLHRNTVREHLDALVEEGLVERHRAPSQGRGRPAWLYRATFGPRSTVGNEYAGLARALAALVERTSDSPAVDATSAGVAWGQELAAEVGPPAGRTAAAARRQVIRIFDRMGFEPQADRNGVEVRLTRCPLLQAAHESPTVVCHVHLGIVQGALAAYGRDGAASELHPFSEPGACHLRLVADARLDGDLDGTGA
jgi:predicted ArsR family transcriptional regulator